MKQKLLTILAVPLLVSIMAWGFTLRSYAQQADQKPFSINQWRVNTEFGFSISIADYVKPAGYEPYSRTIYVYMEPSNFSEQNLKRLFLGLAASQETDRNLFIYVYGDKQALEERIKPKSGYYRKVERKEDTQNEETTLSRKRVYWAVYARTFEKESFDYSPDPDKSETVTVTLRARVIPYTGIPDSDLVLAAMEGDAAKTLEMIAQGADVSTKGKEGDTGLMFAVLRRNIEITKLLLTNGADVNLSNLEGYTALMYAATNKDVDATRILLENGAHVNTKNRYGDSALTLAIHHDSAELVKVLLSKGADVNVQDEHGNTPLIIAILGSRNRVVIDLLLGAGADTQIRNRKGQTALMAAKEKASECRKVIELVSAEAKRTHLNDISQESASLFAEERRLKDLIELLNKK
jgi:hypothetical protein